MLTLSNKPVIAKGKRQHIYEHPNEPSLLVKLPQPGTYDAHGQLPDVSWIERRLRRATMYNGFLREFREYLELKARKQEPGALLPICEVHGTMPTDLGLGLVYERISDPDGNLSPTLRDMIRAGRLNSLHLKLLNDFFDALMENHVVISNKNLKNIVFQTQGDGLGRFVWIDSFGCKQLVPLRKWLKWLNTRGLNKVRDRVVGQAEAALAHSNEAIGVSHFV